MFFISVSFTRFRTYGTRNEKGPAFCTLIPDQNPHQTLLQPSLLKTWARNTRHTLGHFYNFLNCSEMDGGLYLHARKYLSLFSPQLDYSVTWQKLKDVFKVAGRIVNVEIQEDSEGRSKGCAVVQFEEPTEAISAICILLNVGGVIGQSWDFACCLVGFCVLHCKCCIANQIAGLFRYTLLHQLHVTFYRCYFLHHSRLSESNIDQTSDVSQTVSNYWKSLLYFPCDFVNAINRASPDPFFSMHITESNPHGGLLGLGCKTWDWSACLTSHCPL